MGDRNCHATASLLPFGCGVNLWLSEQVARWILRQGQKFRPFETGGLLLGWVDGVDRVVTGLIGPGPDAAHYRHKFVPDHQWQMARLDEAFAGSRGDLNYIGDWHTHPQGPALMSRVDKRTLSRIARKIDHPVMLIGDPTSSDVTFGAWTARKTGWFGTALEDVPIELFEPPASWPSIVIS